MWGLDDLLIEEIGLWMGLGTKSSSALSVVGVSVEEGTKSVLWVTFAELERSKSVEVTNDGEDGESGMQCGKTKEWRRSELELELEGKEWMEAKGKTNS